MKELLNQGRVQRPRRPSAGDGALLLIVDSEAAYHDRSIVDETVTVPLMHYGLPFRFLDLAQERLNANHLTACAAVVVAQAGVTRQLGSEEARLLASAVEDGLGLVNLDWDLRSAPGQLLGLFGFGGVERLPIASNRFIVPGNDHWVTELHRPRAVHESGRMVTALIVDEWGDATVPLVEAILAKEQLVYIRHLVPGNAFEPKHYPVVFAAQSGRGRAVQYLVNPRLWRKSAVGHLGGLGDIFWRSIIWTARKPFVANITPPFVTLSFDDCSGRKDFRYLDVCTEHGLQPMASLFLDQIEEEHRTRLRAKAAAGEILVNSHAWDYYDLAYYDFGVDEYPRETLEEIFQREDAFYRWLGAEPCTTVRSHWGEHGVRSLPFLKQRGRTYINVPIHIGEHKADQFRSDPGEGYWPYDTVKCFYDYLPDDNDFYIFGAFAVRHLADFLTGATILLEESPRNDLDKAVDQAVHHLERGLANGFYGELVTHEHKLGVLTLAEWDRILDRTLARMAPYDVIPTDHDTIARYVKSKDESHLAKVDRLDGSVTFRLKGEAAAPLRLSLFRDVDDGVERSYVDVPAFEGQAEASA